MTSHPIAAKDLPDSGKFQITAYLFSDYEVRPQDYDCYDDEAISRWFAGEWSYVTIVVKAALRGIELGSASLGAVEHGYIYAADFVDAFDQAPQLVEEAVLDAYNNLLAITAAANEGEAS